jgi:hypothetical protein
MRVPHLPDTLLPGDLQDSDPYFDMPSVGDEKGLYPMRNLVKVVCPKCKGDYWADPLRKCSRCHVGFVWVEEDALPLEHKPLRSVRENEIDSEVA